MKKLLARIRTADRRLLAANTLIVIVIGAAGWGASHLVGLLVATHHEDSLNEAGRSGYVFGFLMAFVFTDVVRRITRARDQWLDRTETATTD